MQAGVQVENGKLGELKNQKSEFVGTKGDGIGGAQNWRVKFSSTPPPHPSSSLGLHAQSETAQGLPENSCYRVKNSMEERPAPPRTEKFLNT